MKEPASICPRGKHSVGFFELENRRAFLHLYSGSPWCIGCYGFGSLCRLVLYFTGNGLKAVGHRCHQENIHLRCTLLSSK